MVTIGFTMGASLDKSGRLSDCYIITWVLSSKYTGRLTYSIEIVQRNKRSFQFLKKKKHKCCQIRTLD